MTTGKRSRPSRDKSARTIPPDHAALGEQALVMRREKRYDEALELYRQATEAAARAGDRVAEATWISKQGQIHRLREEPEEAQGSFVKAREMFEALGDAGLAGLADQEGNLGLLAADRGDDFASEYAYRRAIDLAEAAGDTQAVGLWAGNLGNSLSRRRRYRRAWEAYEKSVYAAQCASDPVDTVVMMAKWAASCASAHRWDLAARQYHAAAQAAPNVRERSTLVVESLRASMRAGEWNRVALLGPAALESLREADAPALALAQVDQMMADAEQAQAAAKQPMAHDPAAARLLPLDEVAIGAMAHYEKAKDTSGMAWVAHLMCDIQWAFVGAGSVAWKRLTSQECLYYRILGDAMYALCEADRAEESLELSQRFKGAAFALPAIRAAECASSNLPEVHNYLQALAALRRAVAALAEARPWEYHSFAYRVRAAGEALLEAGEYLRDRDRGAHARLGGVTPPRQLMDALPSIDTVGIVDFMTTSKGMLAHIIGRVGADVRVYPALAPVLPAKIVADLALLWGPEMVHGSDLERQRQVLAHVGKALHDRFFCQLAHELIHLRIGQAILVPDMLTRHLPLHLAGVCAQDITIPGVPVADAEYFCEVLPVEYAPCVQAVALSQHQRRPPNLERIASFSDARSDLPGARHTGQWLSTRIGENIEYKDRSGTEVTRSLVEEEMQRCGLVMIATHGRFDTEHPEASFLQLHDHDWTALDIAALPTLERSPGVVLAACEISAANPGEQPEADGVPGALLSAGAAFVVGSRWPVEDVSMGYLIERFLHHMTNIGLRPSAVLFRAIKDVRRLGREDTVQRCRALLEQMGKDGTRERMPDAYARLDWFALQLEAGGKERPFEEPRYWGGVVVTGSGWNGMAGGVAAGPERLVEMATGLERGRALLAGGKAAEAKCHLTELAGQSDGLFRAQALELLATAVVESAHPVCRSTALWEARARLDEAAFVARGEQREQVSRNIAATRAKLELLQET